MYPYKNILLATDLNEESEIVAQRAKIMAERYGAKLTIVHVIEPVPTYGYMGFEDLLTPVLEVAREHLTNLANKLAIPIEDTHIQRGLIKHEILKAAKTLHIDLVIVGSHGRHGLSRLLGSGANAITLIDECDVLTIRLPVLA